MLDLGEQDRDILVLRRIGFDVSVALVLLYGFFELISRYEFQQVAEDRFQLARLFPPLLDRVFVDSIIQ